MRYLVLIAGLLLSACAEATPQPEPSPTASPPTEPQSVVRANPAPASMPADCFAGRPDLIVDTSAALVVPTTATEIERSTNSLQNRPAPVAIALAQVTMHLQDQNGRWVNQRPAWVVYRTGEMNKLPSGGPFLPMASPTTRPVYMSTASITVVDALTGEPFWGIDCGIVRAS